MSQEFDAEQSAFDSLDELVAMAEGTQANAGVINEEPPATDVVAPDSNATDGSESDTVVDNDAGENAEDTNTEEVDAEAEPETGSDEGVEVDELLGNEPEADNGIEQISIDSSLAEYGIQSEQDIKDMHEALTITKAKLNAVQNEVNSNELFGVVKDLDGVDKQQLAIALEAMKGNKDAMNLMFQKNNIDPLDFATDVIESKVGTEVDTEAYNKEATVDPTVASREIFKSFNIDESTLEGTLGSWDEVSRADILGDSDNAVRIAKEIQSGDFQKTMERVSVLKKADFRGTYDGKDALDMYAIASRSLMDEAAQPEPVQQQQVKKVSKPRVTKAEINDKRAEEAIKASNAKTTIGTPVSNGTGASRSFSGFDNDDDLFKFVDSIGYI